MKAKITNNEVTEKWVLDLSIYPGESKEVTQEKYITRAKEFPSVFSVELLTESKTPKKKKTTKEDN